VAPTAARKFAEPTVISSWLEVNKCSWSCGCGRGVLQGSARELWRWQYNDWDPTGSLRCFYKL